MSILSLDQKKNRYLHYLLSTLRSSELELSRNVSSSQSTEQLERTYKKALSDYQLACEQLEAQTTSASKEATKLRARLNEKEDKAEKLALTLQEYREDIANQSSFANGKRGVMDLFEELESKDNSEELERERLRHITNKVNVSQLEQKLRRKNELAGGVSDIEFNNLTEMINKSEQKIKSYDAELVKMNVSGEKLLKLESFLTTAIQNYTEKNISKERELKEMNEEINEKKRALENLEKKSQSAKKEIGYDASDIGAFLQTRMVNDDFLSSKVELDSLKSHARQLKSKIGTSLFCS